MSAARRLVVTGATGKQGGALISALLSLPSQPFEIYAVTRDKTSRAAQALGRLPRVHLVQGNFDDPKAIFDQVGTPWGLFSVTNPVKGAALEEAQGKAMTTAALAAGVQHIAFTATDRGGDETSETMATPVPHFASKYNVERDIISATAASPQRATWTFLRPVAFFENLGPGFFGRAMMAMWRLNGDSRRLQMVGTADIGRVAADALLHADAAEYRNRAISLAGDDLSPDEAAAIFLEVTGEKMPEAFPLVGRALRWGLKDQLGRMFDWFASDGFAVDVQALRRRYPFLKDFRAWLKEESAWKQGA